MVRALQWRTNLALETLEHTSATDRFISTEWTHAYSRGSWASARFQSTSVSPRPNNRNARSVAAMTDARIVTVFGATGAQGGGVAKHLLDQGSSWKVRAVTRNVHSPQAKQLVEQGADVVQADLNDEQLVRQAIAGSYAVYALVNFWDPSIGEKELQLGTQLAHIATEEAVQVFVWAGLPDVERISGGKLHVPHFTVKAKVWEKVKSLQLPVVISLEAASYYQNFEKIPVMNFSKAEDGTAILKFPILGPKDSIASFDTGDLGLAVLAILDDPHLYDRRRIVFDKVSKQPVSEFANAFTRVTGVKTRHETIPYEVLAGFSKEIAEMCAWFKEYGYYGGETDFIDASDISKTPLTTFEQWLRSSSSIPEQFE